MKNMTIIDYCVMTSNLWKNLPDVKVTPSENLDSDYRLLLAYFKDIKKRRKKTSAQSRRTKSRYEN